MSTLLHWADKVCVELLILTTKGLEKRVTKRLEGVERVDQLGLSTLPAQVYR